MPHDPPARRKSSKLDARLFLLLRLEEQTRRALWHHERTQLRVLAERLQALEAKDQGKATIFAPITTGYDEPGAGQEARISAFIAADCSAAELRKMGAEVRSQSHDVFTAFIPVSRIEAIAASPSVRHIELARAVFPSLDVAAANGQVDQLHNAASPMTGKGVTVAILDSVLDLYHRNFQEPANRTRVRFLWDQTLAATPNESSPAQRPFDGGGATPSYGVEYDDAAIDAQLAAFVANRTSAYTVVRHKASVTGAHGTAVAGIAVGNGMEPSPSGAKYIGAAPEADIIFVGLPDLYTSDVLADMTQVADGFAYAFDRAAKLGLPCVANLSDGDNLGPHDGTAWGEQYLDGLLEVPGRAITLSAGNSTATGSHATGTIIQGATKRLTVNCAGAATKSDALQIWYDGHDRFEVTVTLPTLAQPLGPLVAGSGAVAQATLPNGTIVQLTSDVAMANNGDNLIELIFAVGAGGDIPAGNIFVDLRGASIINGAFHAWLDRNNRPKIKFTTDLDENATTLGSPGTARRAITVGNHKRAMPPGIASNSGRGPTRDGRIKPEIAATGVNVFTTVSRDRTVAGSTVPSYLEFNGTSASAPLVAGACACLLQCQGAGTSWSQLKQILQDGAGTTGLMVPSNTFGFGYMQVGQGCAAPQPACDVWLRDDATDNGQEPFTGPVAWLSPDIEVLDMNRAPAANPMYTAGNAVNNIIRVTVRNRGAGVARNTEAYLYWADPATYLPYPSAWNIQGIYTATAGAFVNQANAIAIPQLGAGQSTAVEFGFAPPAPGSNLRGDDHFCLLVRLENPGDPSGVASGGWTTIATRNNIALRNLHVVKVAQSRRAGTRFFVRGTGERDSLLVTPHLAEGDTSLRIALRALRWRQGNGNAPPDLQQELAADALAQITGITGASRAVIADGLVTVFLAGSGPLRIPDLRLQAGVAMPVLLQVENARPADERRFVHVAQRSGGRLVGGISLALRRG